LHSLDPHDLLFTGLVADGDAKKFRFYREVEIKHGRVAMAAVLGYLIQELARFPGAIDLDGTSFEAIPNGVGAIGAIPSLGWLQIVGSVGYWDLVVWEDRKGTEAGDFGTGYFGKGLEGEVKAEKLTKEIQNGRLAMLGIIELLTHDIARPAGEGLFVLHHF
jgi:light-harvesting complex I chlorophyll a/b binding protein 1